MTAIAYRDGVLATDSLTGGGNIRRGTACKIARNAVSRTMGAACGQAGMCDQFRRWIRYGTIDKWIVEDFPDPLPVKAERGEFGAIIVTGEGRVICVDYGGRSVLLDAPFYVDGSAEEILLGAMAAGATAAEAVAIAIEYDVGCGGEVQVEYLNE